MRQYLQLCEHILDHGVHRPDRTGTGTLSIFGYQMRFDLSEGFPLMTTKKMDDNRFDSIVHELLWFLNGHTNLRYLLDRDVHIWNADAYRAFKQKFKAPDGEHISKETFLNYIQNSQSFAEEYGDLGRIYGAQWRSWAGADGKVIDQIDNVIDTLETDPYGRRHIVTAWNPSEVGPESVALPPCHVLFQFYVAKGKLSCQLYQRSGDVFLGVPFNVASYALLTMLLAKQLGLGLGDFVHTLGDAHIYTNHLEQIREQVTREPKPLPQLRIRDGVPDIYSYKREDFELIGYTSHPALKGKVSVGD